MSASTASAGAPIGVVAGAAGGTLLLLALFLSRKRIKACLCKTKEQKQRKLFFSRLSTKRIQSPDPWASASSARQHSPKSTVREEAAVPDSVRISFAAPALPSSRPEKATPPVVAANTTQQATSTEAAAEAASAAPLPSVAAIPARPRYLDFQIKSKAQLAAAHGPEKPPIPSKLVASQLIAAKLQSRKLPELKPEELVKPLFQAPKPPPPGLPSVKLPFVDHIAR